MARLCACPIWCFNSVSDITICHVNRVKNFTRAKNLVWPWAQFHGAAQHKKLLSPKMFCLAYKGCQPMFISTQWFSAKFCYATKFARQNILLSTFMNLGPVHETFYRAHKNKNILYTSNGSRARVSHLVIYSSDIYGQAWTVRVPLYTPFWKTRAKIPARSMIVRTILKLRERNLTILRAQSVNCASAIWQFSERNL